MNCTLKGYTCIICLYIVIVWGLKWSCSSYFWDHRWSDKNISHARHMGGLVRRLVSIQGKCWWTTTDWSFKDWNNVCEQCNSLSTTSWALFHQTKDVSPSKVSLKLIWDMIVESYPGAISWLVVCTQFYTFMGFFSSPLWWTANGYVIILNLKFVFKISNNNTFYKIVSAALCNYLQTNRRNRPRLEGLIRTSSTS